MTWPYWARHFSSSNKIPIIVTSHIWTKVVCNLTHVVKILFYKSCRETKVIGRGLEANNIAISTILNIQGNNRLIVVVY
jgi:hypothetical protein